MDIERRETADSVSVRAGIRQALANAITALWQLDSIVRNQLASTPDALVAWKRSRRVGYPGKPTATHAA